MIDTMAYSSVARRRKVRKGNKAGNGRHSVYMWIFTIDRLHARRIRLSMDVGLTSSRRRTEKERRRAIKRRYQREAEAVSIATESFFFRVKEKK